MKNKRSELVLSRHINGRYWLELGTADNIAELHELVQKESERSQWAYHVKLRVQQRAILHERNTTADEIMAEAREDRLTKLVALRGDIRLTDTEFKNMLSYPEDKWAARLNQYLPVPIDEEVQRAKQQFKAAEVAAHALGHSERAERIKRFRMAVDEDCCKEEQRQEEMLGALIEAWDDQGIDGMS